MFFFMLTLKKNMIVENIKSFRLIEEADFKSAKELFGKKGNDEKTLDNFIPKSESDFMEYAELLSHKIRPFEVLVSILNYFSCITLENLEY
jgi:Translation initiation factor eIF3 subunit